MIIVHCVLSLCKRSRLKNDERPAEDAEPLFGEAFIEAAAGTRAARVRTSVYLAFLLVGILSSEGEAAPRARRDPVVSLAGRGGYMIQNACPKINRVAFRIMTAPTKTDILLDLARRGPVRARDLDPARIPRTYLRRLCERGLLEQVDRGLYRLADGPVTELHSLAEVAKRVPQGIICLMSALEVHGLTTEAPHAVWVTIDRHARMPRLAYPKLEVVRASGPAREHGVEVRSIEDVQVRITTPAKTVADCFRYRRHVGLETALAALRDYLARSRSRRSRGDYGIDALVRAARADRVYTLMRPYSEALA
jgi:hypothetical protein